MLIIGILIEEREREREREKRKEKVKKKEDKTNTNNKHGVNIQKKTAKTKKIVEEFLIP